MTACELDYYTDNGNCDNCIYGQFGECHLQCTHEDTEECTFDYNCEFCCYNPLNN